MYFCVYVYTHRSLQLLLSSLYKKARYLIYMRRVIDVDYVLWLTHYCTDEVNNFTRIYEREREGESENFVCCPKMVTDC